MDQLAKWLVEQIEAGVWEVDERLPSERRLADFARVTRGTARRALNILRENGYAQSGKGMAGTRVRRPERAVWEPDKLEGNGRRDDPVAGWDEWAQAMRAQGLEPEERFLGRFIEVPPLDVRRRLGLQRDQLAVMRRSLWLANHVPMVIRESWFPLWVAEGTPLMEENRVVMSGGILSQIGHAQSVREDDTVARLAVKDEPDLLLLPMTAAILELMLTGFDEQGRPVRCMVLAMRGDRNRIRSRHELA